LKSRATFLPLMTFSHQNNVLIDQSSNARLADFGLVRVLSDSTTLSSPGGGGAIRWMSPELLYPESFGLNDARRTISSDCYALGMTAYEVLSGCIPFPRDGDPAIILKVLRGKRPERPRGAGGKWFTDGVWEILERCWEPEPGDRPSVNCVLQHLEAASKSWTSTTPMTDGPQVAGSSAFTPSAQEGVDRGTVPSSDTTPSQNTSV